MRGTGREITWRGPSEEGAAPGDAFRLTTAAGPSTRPGSLAGTYVIQIQPSVFKAGEGPAATPGAARADGGPAGDIVELVERPRQGIRQAVGNAEPRAERVASVGRDPVPGRHPGTAEASMTRTIGTAAGLMILVAGLATANLARRPGAVAIDWTAVRKPPVEVYTEPATRGPIVQVITAPGIVVPVEEAKIASQIVGRVVAVQVKDGDAVKKGDLLVKLDETDARARLDSALARVARFRAAIAQAEANLGKAGRDERRLDRLNSRGAASDEEKADAHTERIKAGAGMKMNRHELAESEAMCRTSKQELARTEIRAPIDGTVTGLEVEVGEVIIPGTMNLPGTVLMTICDLRRMWVRADVDESDRPLVKPGQPALVYLQSDQLAPIAGTVERVSRKGKKKNEKAGGGAQAQATPAAGTSEVVSFPTRVRIDGDNPALCPGMSATVEIEVRRSADALGVPIQAVVHRRLDDLPDTPALRAWAERRARSRGAPTTEAQYVKIVFVLDGQVVRMRPVETGIVDEHRVAILEGIEPGDRVVVGPFRVMDELGDGQPVKVASE